MKGEKRGLPCGSPPYCVRLSRIILEFLNLQELFPTWVLTNCRVQSDLTAWDRSKIVLLLEDTVITSSIAIDVAVCIQLHTVEVDWPRSVDPSTLSLIRILFSIELVELVPTDE